jgi:hypothetical protein
MRLQNLSVIAIIVSALVVSGCFSAVSADEPTKDTSPKAPAPLPSLANTHVSIPWSELRELLDQRGGGRQSKPPVPLVFSPVTAEAIVDEGRATTTFSGTVESLGDGWTLVPLGPEDAGVVSAEADGQPAPLVMHDKQVCTLLAEQRKTKLSWVVESKVAEAATGNSLSLPLPGAPIVAVTARFAEPGLGVSSIAAVASRVDTDGKATVFTGRYRGGQTVSIQFREPQAAARPPRIYADVSAVALVDEGLVRIHHHLALDVLHSPAEDLRLGVDPDSTVLSVSGDAVGRWSEQGEGDDREVLVDLVKPVLGKQSIVAVTELDSPAGEGDIALTAMELLDARRQQGFLAVATTGAMEVEPTETELPRVSVSQLPSSVRELAGRSPVLAYRYTKPPAGVTLHLTRPVAQPATQFVTTDTLVSVRPDGLCCRAQISYEILHAGVDTLRIGLPGDAELINISAPHLRTKSIVNERKQRILVLDLSDLVRNDYSLVLEYRQRIKPDATSANVGLLTHPDAQLDRGSIGIEVRGSLEVSPTVENLERIDVKELPGQLWRRAASPVLVGYRYGAPEADLSLKITRHQDLDVLVAVSDICEASSVVTPDGKCVTKMMYIVRNNMKPFLTLKLPEGAQMWSALVDDRPVTPAVNAKGEVLIALRKSEEINEDDEESYQAVREKRRSTRPGELERLEDRVERLEELEEMDDAPRDLKPYDVEVVFVTPSIELGERGEFDARLPEVDIPVGHLAWAVFLPSHLRVVDAEGNLKEVSSFQLPFRHFGEDKMFQQARAAEATQQVARAREALQEMAKAVDELAVSAKAEGVLPVRVEIPISGTIHRFEKFLVVDEQPKMNLLYRRKVD